MTDPTILKIEDIRIDGGTQSRASLNDSVVSDYAATVREGGDFPPVIVFFDGTAHWLADGFHRLHGYRSAGAVEIAADVRTGTKRDAILFSVGANASHGLRRTNEDKRKAVFTLLNDEEEWSAWPQTKIAATCGVSQQFVSKLAAELPEGASYNSGKIRTVERGGSTYQQDTANIGGKKLAAPLEPEAEAEPTASPEKASALAENDRIREEHRSNLSPEVQAMEAAKQSRKEAAKAPSEDVEAMQAEIEELREENAELKAEVARLQTDSAKWDDMRVQFEKGGFEAVIAGKDEVIRTQATRIERESHDKAKWMRSAKSWEKKARAHGYSADVIINAKTGELTNA